MKASFAKRRPGVPVMTAGPHIPGTVQRTTIIDGDTVMLRVDREIILVQKTEIMGNGKYRGQIRGFEPSCSLGYQDHSLEDMVEFEETNVFVIQLP
jgi:hypothetical protein